MNTNINETIEVAELVEEMGKKRFEQYLKVYCSHHKGSFNIEKFCITFSNYIKCRRSKSKGGCASISTTSFSFYLKGLDYEDILEQIEEANSKDDIGDSHYYE